MGIVLAPGLLGAEEFLAGADMSHLPFFEEKGIVYKENGQPTNPLKIIKDRGLNCVRLRLFTSSASQAQADPYNFGNNLAQILPLTQRVKAAGMKTILDFHYSDTWADPSHQRKPKAWEDLSFAQLEQEIYTYTHSSITTMKAAGVIPDYVQVGNEIIAGMLWDQGRVGGTFDTSSQWRQLGLLLKSAIKGVRDAAGPTPPKIIIHLDRGADWGSTFWFFNRLSREEVPFDIIAQSYYPWWHGDLEALDTCLKNAASTFQKSVMIMETAYPWKAGTTTSGLETGLPFEWTPEGQANYATALAKIMKAIPNSRGIGIVWWGSEFVQPGNLPLDGFHLRSFFDTEGNVLPVVQTLGKLTHPVALDCESDSENCILRWPLSGADLSLRMTENLSPPVNWVAVPEPVACVLGTFEVKFQMTARPRKFFRLEEE